MIGTTKVRTIRPHGDGFTINQAVVDSLNEVPELAEILKDAEKIGAGSVASLVNAMSAEMQSRFAYPIPDEKQKALMQRIIELMRDGVRRSKKEIRLALDLDEDTEIGARIRAAKLPENGAWCFNDARADGPDPDGIYRHVMRIK